jgi:hypothetical protein
MIYLNKIYLRLKYKVLAKSDIENLFPKSLQKEEEEIL